MLIESLEPQPISPGETVHYLTAGDGERGERLDAWLARALPDLSRSRLQALLRDGRVRVEGCSSRASARLRGGERVRVVVPAPAPARPRPEAIPLDVVHEDSSLLVIDKAAGLVVHPGAGVSSGTLVNALLAHVPDLAGIGGVLRPGIVHRLDKGTSGLLVVAKDDFAHRALVHLFASREVVKEYVALVLGVPGHKEGRIDLPIGRDPLNRKRMSTEAPRGRSARTDWRVLEAFDGAALLRIRIHTGRTHQIRVHLASQGHPVAGDPTYGTRRPSEPRSTEARAALASLTRPALHSAHLEFVHPVTSERVAFDSPLPDDIESVVLRLRATPLPR